MWVRLVSYMVCWHELSTNELVDAALQTIHAQDFDLNINFHSIHAHDVGPPTVKLIEIKCHVSLLSSCF